MGVGGGLELSPMSGDITGARGLRPTSHGGALLPPWKPGVAPNPGGRPLSLKEVRALGKEASPDAMRAMIRIVRDVDEKGRNVEDGRVVVVAAQTILTWTYGKPPDYDPREDKPPVTIDTSVLTKEERTVLLSALRKGLLRSAEEPVVEGGTEAGAAPT